MLFGVCDGVAMAAGGDPGGGSDNMIGQHDWFHFGEY